MDDNLHHLKAIVPKNTVNSMSTDGWTEWSNYVLKELERLNEQLDNGEKEIIRLNSELIKNQEDLASYKELKEWKQRINEIASPTQLESAFKTIDDLKTFKIRVITIFLVAQIIFGIIFKLI